MEGGRRTLQARPAGKGAVAVLGHPSLGGPTLVMLFKCIWLCGCHLSWKTPSLSCPDFNFGSEMAMVWGQKGWELQRSLRSDLVLGYQHFRPPL